MNGHAIGSAASPITNVNFPAAGQTSTIQTLGGAGVNGAGLTMRTPPGTLVLAGSNTFIGGTNVNSGNLAVERHQYWQHHHRRRNHVARHGHCQRGHAQQREISAAERRQVAQAARSRFPTA